MGIFESFIKMYQLVCHSYFVGLVTIDGHGQFDQTDIEFTGKGTFFPNLIKII